MLSICISHAKGFTVCVSRKSVSSLFMKIHVYGRANLVPMAITEICLTSESNLKKLFLSTNSAVSTKSADGTFFIWSSDFLYSALSRVSYRILVCKPTASPVTKNTPSGLLPRLLIFYKKSPVSLTYDFHDFITSWRWSSKNSDTFSVGVLQLDIKGRPGTL